MPVGTREMLEAAIQNGADAVYYGVPHWNARGRTEDFSFEDVAEMIRYARIRSVRTFLAMNILVFEREIRDLPEFLEKLIALKPDAFIIQDIGLARLIKAIAPDQEIHASTQMTLASAEAVNFASQLGFNRAVLARELSLKQIASIKEATPLELEVFVHGALCVSYSGQCLTSENFGGRSANRGQCAQSCRLPGNGSIIWFLDEQDGLHCLKGVTDEKIAMSVSDYVITPNGRDALFISAGRLCCNKNGSVKRTFIYDNVYALELASDSKGLYYSTLTDGWVKLSSGGRRSDLSF